MVPKDTCTVFVEGRGGTNLCQSDWAPGVSPVRFEPSERF